MLSPGQHLSPQRSRQKAWGLTRWGSLGVRSAAQVQISKHSLHHPSQPSSFLGTLQHGCLFIMCRKAFSLLLPNGMLFGFHDERVLGWQKGLLPRQRAGSSCLSLFLLSCCGQQCVSLKTEAFFLTLPSLCLPWPGI